MTTLCKHSGAKSHLIKHPRYHDKRVLIAAHNVKNDNIIKFTEAKSLPGVYYLSGKTIRKYKQESNGVIAVYSVPLSEMSTFELAEHCLHEIDWPKLTP